MATPSRSGSPMAASIEEVQDEDTIGQPPRLTSPRPSSPSRPRSNRNSVSLEEDEDEDNVCLPSRHPSPTQKSPNPSSSTSQSPPKSSEPTGSASSLPKPPTPPPPPDSGPKISTSAPFASTKTSAQGTTDAAASKKPKKKKKKNKDVSDAPALDPVSDDEDTEDVLHGRGLSGIVEKERVEWLESLLPTYLNLGKASKEKSDFWEAFPAQYFSLFPISKYPAPASTLEPLPELTEEQRKKMTGSQKKARKKKEARRAQSDEQRVVAQCQRWFWYRQNKNGRDQHCAFDKYMRRLRTIPQPPRKLTTAQFLMVHPDHRDAIRALSDETGDEDRLPERNKAAREYTEALEPVDRLRLEAERDAQYVRAMEQWNLSDAEEVVEEFSPEDQSRCRENLPRVLQPLLNAISRYTGMSLFLQGGLELDNPELGQDYDTISMCSVAEGCPRLDRYDIAQFSSFGTHFLSWLNTVEKIKLGLLPPTDAMLGPQSSKLPDGLDGLIVMEDGEDAAKPSRRPKKGKGVDKGKKKASAKRTRARKQDEVSEEEDESDEEDEEDEGEEDGEMDVEVEGGPRRWAASYKPSAYELQREANIARNKAIMEELGLRHAASLLVKEVNGEINAKAAAQPPRPKPKPVEPKSTSSRVTRSQTASTSTRLNSPSSLVGAPANDSPANDSVEFPANDPPHPAERSGTAGSNEQRNTDAEDNANVMTVDIVSASQPPSQAPSSTNAVRTQFLEAFENYDLNFDPVLEKVDPEAYADQQGEIKQHGVFLLDVPADGVARTRPLIYEALVYRWMELESVLRTLDVPLTKLNTRFRPIGFQQWFKNGRVDRASGFRTPPSVQLSEIRASWWKYFSDNMPEWRMRIDGRVTLGGEGDWEDCELPGQDGVVLLIVALKWWHDVGGIKDRISDWDQAAKALYFTLDQTLSNRRKATPPEASTSSTLGVRKSPEDNEDPTTSPNKRHRSA
ncbi:hypothetical protein V5O48_008206 [Marasmius crinis-equi]|uniref:Uncharacterized protein n=1 Tax=Marasmius crinis-equi TaxID=585013 RepID=A0ABR3FER2_9AGAR